MKFTNWFSRCAAVFVLMVSFASFAFGQQADQSAAPIQLSQMTETPKADTVAPAGGGQTPPAPFVAGVVASGTLATPSAAVASPTASASTPSVTPSTEGSSCTPPSEPLQPMEVPSAPTKPKDHPGH